jgi:anti-sigma factor RsiW
MDHEQYDLLISAYLDDELNGRELEALRQRLNVEPALTAAIDELRSQRWVTREACHSHGA